MSTCNDERSLWLRKDVFAVHLMAKMNGEPVGLRLPVESCFEVRVLRVDHENNSIFLRPVTEDGQFEELERLLQCEQTSDVHSQTAVPIRNELVYLVADEDAFYRGALVTGTSTCCLMYAIDKGTVDFANVDVIRALPARLQDVPPLAFRARLASCIEKADCDVLSDCEQGRIYSCKICKVTPETHVAATENMYPPAVFMQLYKKEEDGSGLEKYTEIICTKAQEVPGWNSGGKDGRVLRKSTLKQSGNRAQTSFKPFNPRSIPCKLLAAVTEKIDYDLYRMRDVKAVDEIRKSFVNPSKQLDSRLISKSGVACIAVLVRPRQHSVSTVQAYRAIASDVDLKLQRCTVLLVDYGQSLICETKALFSLEGQPETVCAAPVASFTCFVTRVIPVLQRTPTFKLMDEEHYTTFLKSKYDGGPFEGVVLMPRMKRYNWNRQIFNYEKVLSADEVVEEKVMKSKGKHGKERTRAGNDEKSRKESVIQSQTPASVTGGQMTLTALQLGIMQISKKMDYLAGTSFTTLQNKVASASGVTCGGTFGENQLGATVEQMCAQMQRQLNFAAVGIPAVTSDTTRMQNDQMLASQMKTFGYTQVHGAFNNTDPNHSSTNWQTNTFNGFLQNPVGTSSGSWMNSPLGSMLPMSFMNGVPVIPYAFPVPCMSPWSPSQDAANKEDDAGWEQRSGRRKGDSRRGFRNENKVREEGWNYGQTGGRNDLTREENGRRNNRVLNGVRRPRARSSTFQFDKESSGRRPYGFGDRKDDSQSPRSDGGGSFRLLSEADKGVNGRGPFHFGGPKNQPQENWHDEGHPPKSDSRSGLLKQRNGVGPKVAQQAMVASHKEAADDLSSFCMNFSNEQPSIEKGRILYVLRERDENGRILYTSDEDSSFDSASSVEDRDEQQAKQQADFALLNVHLRLIDDDGPSILKYKALFEYVKIDYGETLTVKRSDDDVNNAYWPLFFVQIQKDDMLIFMEDNLDSLQPSASLPLERVQVGTLCASFCHAFSSMFRAIITRVDGDEVEVHYIDYGNYEVVSASNLKSIDDQPECARTHPAMAIPCVLAACEEKRGTGEAALKEAVSCERDSFRLRFVEKREDGISVVELVSDQ